MATERCSWWNFTLSNPFRLDYIEVKALYTSLNYLQYFRTPSTSTYSLSTSTASLDILFFARKVSKVVILICDRIFSSKFFVEKSNYGRQPCAVNIFQYLQIHNKILLIITTTKVLGIKSSLVMCLICLKCNRTEIQSLFFRRQAGSV